MVVAWDAALVVVLIEVLTRVLRLMEVARVVGVVGLVEDVGAGGWPELGVDSATPLEVVVVLEELQLLEGWVT